MKYLYRLVTLFAWTAFAASGSCPPQAIITPCTCDQTINGLSVQCKGPEDTERISSAIGNIRNSKNLKLVLESVTLPVLPDSVISEISALSLRNVRIEKISDNSSYTWSKLSSVVIESSTVLEKPWPYFKGAKLLRSLKIGKLEIPRIGSEFREAIPDTVGFLDIRRTGTTALEKHAMSHLKNLWYLSMVDVPLQELKRDALPLVMPKLYSLTLVNTQIEKLDPGFFEGMPKLEALWLHGNKLSTLGSELLAPVRNHLKYLMAEGNPLTCDCSLIWMTIMDKEGSMKALVSCTDDSQEIKQVSTLEESEYCS